jgi:hypothetical protein
MTALTPLLRSASKVARRLYDRWAAALRLIALSGEDVNDNRGCAKTAGLDHLLARPVRLRICHPLPAPRFGISWSPRLALLPRTI